MACMILQRAKNNILFQNDIQYTIYCWYSPHSPLTIVELLELWGEERKYRFVAVWYSKTHPEELLQNKYKRAALL